MYSTMNVVNGVREAEQVLSVGVGISESDISRDTCFLVLSAKNYDITVNQLSAGT